MEYKTDVHDNFKINCIRFVYHFPTDSEETKLFLLNSNDFSERFAKIRMTVQGDNPGFYTRDVNFYNKRT